MRQHILSVILYFDGNLDVGHQFVKLILLSQPIFTAIAELILLFSFLKVSGNSCQSFYLSNLSKWWFKAGRSVQQRLDDTDLISPDKHFPRSPIWYLQILQQANAKQIETISDINQNTSNILRVSDYKMNITQILLKAWGNVNRFKEVNNFNLLNKPEHVQYSQTAVLQYKYHSGTFEGLENLFKEVNIFNLWNKPDCRMKITQVLLKALSKA